LSNFQIHFSDFRFRFPLEKSWRYRFSRISFIQFPISLFQFPLFFQ